MPLSFFLCGNGSRYSDDLWQKAAHPAEAGEGLMVRSLGSGANGIGYYMYHGGITPQGKKGFFSDEPSGVPKMSYDFQVLSENSDIRALLIIHCALFIIL